MDENVSRILRARDFYEVLGVQRDCDQETLKRCYRRVAASVHPDRCKDERATEAFQKVSNAYQVLSDEEKRRHYDMYGEERPQRAEPQFQRGHVYVNEIDPDLLRNLFGFHHFVFEDEFPFGGAQFRFRQQRPPQPQMRFSALILIIMMAIILWIMTSFLNNYSSNNLDQYIEQNILFEDMERDDRVQYYKTQTLYSKVPFYIPLSVLNSIYNRIGIYRSGEIRIHIQNIADLQYIDYMKQKCKFEQSTGDIAQSSCKEAARLEKLRPKRPVFGL